MKTQVGWMSSIIFGICDQFDIMVISGDFNLPDILWDSFESVSETLHDHLWTQLNQKCTCGNSILDLVLMITSVPNRGDVTDTDCFQKIRVFVQTTVSLFSSLTLS